MATIEELEQKVQRLERETLEKQQSIDILIAKSVKALDFAQHAYRIDHNSYVWVWDTEEQVYKKTNIHLCTPEVEDKSIAERKLGDKAVSTRTIDDGAVTPEKLNPRVKSEVVDPDIHALDSKYEGITDGLRNQITANDVKYKGITEFLQQEIDSFAAGGVVLMQEFGSERNYGISQKKLTNTINTLYNLLEEALGRTLRGFTWTVTPTYIYGEWPTAVHVTAQPVTLGDVFEHITLKVNGEVIDQVDEQISTYSFDVPLQVSANIHLDAQILGIPYYREQLVSHYDSFWLGAGTDYTDIMDEAHNINISQGSRIARNITAADNDHIFIIIGEAWVPSFIRADMNGVEIPFTEQTVTIDGKTYKVLTSEDSYQAGTYNIDING